MKITSKKSKLFLIIIFIVAFPALLVGITSKMDNPEWLILTILAPAGLFIGELWKSIKGEKIAWDYLTQRDKWLFAASIFIMLLCIGWPIKNNLSFQASLIYFCVGYVFTWLMINLFGSPEARSRLHWPN